MLHHISQDLEAAHAEAAHMPAQDTPGRIHALSRDPVLDGLKGLAIAFVVLGHVILDAGWLGHAGPIQLNLDPGALNPLVSIAYSIQVPLLVFVAGLVFWRPALEPSRTRLLKRVRGLLVPYIAWFFVDHAFDVIAGFQHGTLARSLELALLDSTAPEALWFLYALFMCSLLLLIIEKLPGHRWLLPLSALLSMVLWGALPWRTTLFAATQTLWLYPVFVLGYLVVQHRDAVLDRRKLIAWIALPVFSLLVWLQYPIEVPQRSRLAAVDAALQRLHIPGGFTIAFYACAGAGLLGLYALYAMLPRTVLAPQSWVGRRTLGVYASSGLVESALALARVHAWPSTFVLTMSGSLALTVALERVPIARTLLLAKPVRRVPRRPPG